MASESPSDQLEKIFHEPNRLSIMSNLCAAAKGLSFTELKEVCGLTDGNLNRHLKVLADGDAVTIKKKFVDGKPRTTVTLSRTGLKRFSEYINALENVLEQAREALPAKKSNPGSMPLGRSVTT